MGFFAWQLRISIVALLKRKISRKVTIMSTINQCKNFLITGQCDEWIIEKFQLKEFKGEKIDYLTTADYEKADEICSKCQNFEPVT